MADAAPAQPAQKKSGGAFQRLLITVLILGLLAAVWVLASERNQRHYSIAQEPAGQGSVLVISRGRFFPFGESAIGTSDTGLGKIYGPIPLPAGAKVAPAEFDDQTSLDRALFDLISGWAQGAQTKGDPASLAFFSDLTGRAIALPGLTDDQHRRLAQMRGELSYGEALDLLRQAKQTVQGARRKVAAAVEAGSERALDAAGLGHELETLAAVLDEASQGRVVHDLHVLEQAGAPKPPPPAQGPTPAAPPPVAPAELPAQAPAATPTPPAAPPPRAPAAAAPGQARPAPAR